MSQPVQLVVWLVVGSALTWVLLRWLQRKVAAAERTLDTAARAPEADTKADDLVRVWGLLVAAGGGLCIAVGEGWALAGLLPLPVFGVFGALLGAWMMTFPRKYRELRRRRT